MTASPQTATYDEFLFNATIQMGKPLELILDSCQELTNSLEGSADDSQKQLTQAIRNQGHQMLDLINDIRDYAEMQTGRIVIEKKPTDLNLLLKTVLDAAPWFTKNKPQLSIQQEIPSGLPSLSIMEIRIQQVLFNLLHNAVKFTDAGSIGISAQPGDGQITFQVRDSGIGIPKDRFALVFAPFQTALPDPADARVGLGLGLPISKYMVEAHGGKIWFESTEGQGSTFYFSLPVE